MARPNFFIVGAPKCGTTALDQYLGSHPEIFMCPTKDLNFFSCDLPGIRRVVDEARYLEFFDGAPPHSAVGEASSLYLFSEEAISRIAAFAPDAKLIAVVRNPVDLVYSLHSQLLYSHEEDEENFEAAWALQSARAAGRKIPKRASTPRQLQYEAVGRTGAQLERALERIAETRLKVLLFDDFVADTRAAYEEVLAFLGVPSDGRRDFAPVNAGKRHRIPAVGKLTEQPPALLRAVLPTAKKFLGLKEFGLLDKVRAVNDVPLRRPPLRPAFRNELNEVFRDDIRLLEKLLGRNLDPWLTGSAAARG